MTVFTVLDATTSSEEFRYTTYRAPFSLEFSLVGQSLAAGLMSCEVLLYRMTEEGREREQLEFACGHSIVRSLAFNPDSTLLAAGEASGKIWGWEVESRHRCLVLQTFIDAISYLTFSPNGSRLVASTVSGTTYFYVLPLDELTELVRSRLILPMTPSEYQTYLHQETCIEWP